MTGFVADTTLGQVEGVSKLGCLQFRGVPFTAPPVGELRWRPPQPAEPWDGVRDATRWGPICPQILGTMEALGAARVRPEQPPMDEAGCLNLNVFTPTLDDERRPVMFWIHGGAFSTGSGRIPWYSGHNFARDGVVVVTVNYRVSAFGFLHLEELFGPRFRGSGISGTLDQIAALEWTRDNIANFGGDPDNVTIFGESAGGMSVGTLLASPAAKGLFHKAIAQSGASHASHTPEVANRISEMFCEKAGVQPGDTRTLAALSSQDVVTAVEQIQLAIANEDAAVFGTDHAGFAMPFQPVHGTDALPTFPIDAVRGGAGAGIPTIVGTTLEEWKLFSLALKPEALKVRAVRPLRNLCERAGRSAEEVVAAYEKTLAQPNELSLRNALETDRNFRIPAIRLAEAQVDNGSPTWMYRFDWKSPAFGGRMGACHAIEIPFVFDNLDAPGVDIFTGGAAPKGLAMATHDAWVTFAKTGDPKTAELPDWPEYDTARRATMLLDTEPKVVDDPEGEMRQIWDGLI